MTPQQVIANICRAHGPSVNVPQGLDGARVLWALAGCESDFGAYPLPRHEPAYCYGGRCEIKTLSRVWGCAAHASYGPWQMMFCHLNDVLASPLRDPALLIFASGSAGPDFDAIADSLCAAAVEFLNSEILGRQQATTLAEIAKAWNHGNWRDQFDDSEYTDRAAKFYAYPFPDVPAPGPTTEGTHAPAPPAP